MAINPPAMTGAETLPILRIIGREARAIETQRLKRARHAMPQMEADQHHHHDIQTDGEGRAEVLQLGAVEFAHSVANVVRLAGI